MIFIMLRNVRMASNEYIHSAPDLQVLECHSFICTSERAANSLVRCCFHSYADTMYIRINDRKALREDRSRSASPNDSEQQAR